MTWTHIASLQASTSEDMALVESEIARHLGGEGGRCGWLRSSDYIRLRVSALYFPHLCATEPLSVHCQGLRVSLLDGTVTLSRRDRSEGSHVKTLEEYLAIQASERRSTGLGKRLRGTHSDQ